MHPIRIVSKFKIFDARSLGLFLFFHVAKKLCMKEKIGFYSYVDLTLLTNAEIFDIITLVNRGVAQLVARDVWDVDAAGSNPVTPTNSGIHKAFEYHKSRF